ncbi:MAG: Tat pathway signal sequence domain protein [Pseudomonadota bacterium]
MRRALTVSLLGLFAASAIAATPALAQRRPGGDDQQEQQDAARKKKRDQEWNQPAAPLAQLRNAGPCPFVKVLYDAGRYVEFKDGREAAANVAYTGEVQGLSSGCAYKDDEPIRVEVELLFALGKGPQASGDNKTYRYWVAVTQRNQSIIAKEYFDLPVKFQPGQDRAMVTEKLEGIVIPRASIETSGSNFEVLIGFDVTPQMAAFNRDGKRFRVTAGGPQAATAPTAGTPTQP